MAEEFTTADVVRLTRALAEAQGVEATMRFFGPQSVYDMSRFGLPVFEGYPAIRSFIEDWYGSYQEADDDLQEIVGLGNGVVFSAVRETARPSGSPEHARVHAEYSVVVEWTGAKVARLTAYRDTDEARAAARRLVVERGQAMSRET